MLGGSECQFGTAFFFGLNGPPLRQHPKEPPSRQALNLNVCLPNPKNNCVKKLPFHVPQGST
jgi:hypothetical protein